MIFATIKDKKNRFFYSKLENKILVNKFIKINLLNNIKIYKKRPFILKALLLRLSNKKLFKYSKVRIVRRCVLTNSSKSVYRSYNLSRSIFRNLLQFGFIPGYKKAVW
jgi:ribosomal protein S14